MNVINIISNATTAAYIHTETAVRSFARNKKGVTAVEYAIVMAGVAGVVAIIFAKGGKVEEMLNAIFENVQKQVTGVVSP